MEESDKRATELVERIGEALQERLGAAITTPLPEQWIDLLARLAVSEDSGKRR
jgi:hypothetical protein